MQKIIYIVCVALVLFSGCTTKNYYEPKNTVDIKIKQKDTTGYISEITPNGGTLDNNKIISKDGISKLSLDKDFEFINNVNGIIIAANPFGKLYLNEKGKITYHKFKKRVISASIHDNYMAVGFVDNSIIIYDRIKKEILLKEYYKTSIINDNKIANPIFLSSVVLYPTLDGKIIVIDFTKHKIVKTINIDPQSDINNIIFLKNIEDSLIAATPKKLFSFVDGKIKIVDHNIKNVVVTEKYIYISTLEGEIIKYDHLLNKLNSKKYKYAKFIALGYTSKLYIVESQGFLVELDDELKKDTVYDFSFDEDYPVMILDDKLYFDDQYMILK